VKIIEEKEGENRPISAFSDELSEAGLQISRVLFANYGRFANKEGLFTKQSTGGLKTNLPYFVD
jgi:hypothetical protein